MGKRSLIYLAGDLGTRSIAFLLVPVYTRFLAPSDYGVLGVLGSVSAVIGTICLLGLPGSVTRYYFEFNEDARRRAFFRAVWTALAIVAVGVGVVLSLTGRLVSARLLPGVPFAPLVILMIWTAALGCFPAIPLAIYRAAERPLAYVSLSFSSFLVAAALMVGLVAFARMAVFGAVLAQFLANAILAAAAAWLMWPMVRGRARREDLVSALAFGIPLIPHTLASWALNVSDRLILQFYVPLSDIGIYSLGYQFGMVMMMVGASVNNVWSPYFIQRALDPVRSKSLSSDVTRFVAVTAWLTLAVTLLAPDAIRVLANERYAGAALIAPVVALGYGFLMLYFVPTNVLFVAKRTGLLAACSGGAAIANVLLNLWLVPRWGIHAAAANTAIAFALELVAVSLVAGRLAPFRYEGRRIAAVLLVAAPLLVAGLTVRITSVPADLGFKALLLLLFPATLWYGRVTTAGERSAIAAAVAGVLRSRRAQP